MNIDVFDVFCCEGCTFIEDICTSEDMVRCMLLEIKDSTCMICNAKRKP